MTLRRWTARVAFAVAVVALLAVGYLPGSNPLPVVGVPEAAFSFASFAAFILVSGVVFAYKFRTEPRADPADDPVTAVVPTYRDAQVLHRSVESLAAVDHPVDITVVVEPDDAAGRERARELAADHDAVSVLVNPDPGTKAAGVNAAIDAADTDLYGVFDADQEVDADFFRRVTGFLDRYDVVQTRFVPRPSGVVESLAYYEFMLFGHCFRQLLYAFTGFRMATSKALVFSDAAVANTGGYDPDMISEDYDFAHRCYLAGVDVKMLYTTTVREESAHTLADWWGQRKRWMTGNVQVLHRLLSTAARRPDHPRSYVSLGVGVASIGGSAFLLTIVGKLPVLADLDLLWVAALPVLAIYAVAIGIRRVDDYPLGWDWLLTPLVLPFFSLIAVMAFADYLLDFSGEWFAVEKGE
ncbi:glycosyltransferase [Halocalculus aciditolerans]|uniref:Glycosyltransferase n=1 Tax=Halocalculus aciditolerans TaxID=1383812 RepID=A0A830F141_9EURY|nr:glycosyltransferase family 2 protein [Halocalculus aciditolerans]GGL51077.1 hypothetical protein GCM10009039_06680 [Halocalculus aciditolerans]